MTTSRQRRPADALPVDTPLAPVISADELAALERVQQRLLWLSTLIVHHANYVRPNHDGTKVGGHQASSASMISILTALYFHYLRPGDRVAVKPHASPVFHAIQYLLGQLPEDYLPTLRSFGGLQAYPSRTKDPDHVDFSTGSVGLGAVAPAFAALAGRYATAHFGAPDTRRFVALVGDAELDEGNVWEAILDPALAGLEHLLWIVDLNRQSLDRVVPGIRAAHLKRLFAESGWRVLEAKYGRRLQALFAREGGAALRQRIDEMRNEEYQALIRLPGAELRPRLLGDDPALAALLADVPDAELPQILANLGGHDLEELLATLAQADEAPRRPTIIFAYTIKGWGLPIAGHPLNHSQLLTTDQIETLRDHLGIKSEALWASFEPASPEGQLCTAVAQRLYGPHEASLGARERLAAVAATIPDDLEVLATGQTSTQESFGRALMRLSEVPGLRERIVTTSPDVSVSTNLSGWINKTGVYAPTEEPDFESAEVYRLLRWQRGPSGQHIELGISEMNLFMLLGMFGLSHELLDELLLPIGTVYDPFVCRGLDALIYGLYAGAKFVVAGTPSGITLAPEGGAHQSTVTPSLGIELPNLHSFEPCFAVELVWTLLEGLTQCCDREKGRATYLRLSTRPLDQGLLEPALQRLGRAALRRQVLAGGYRLIDRRDHADHPASPVLQLAAAGAVMPEVVAAADYLRREGVAVNVLNLTSPRRLYEAWRAGDDLTWLIPPDEATAPFVTVHDASSHALAWLGSIYGAPVLALGVDAFGQSGTRDELYRAFGLDVESIIKAGFAAVDRMLVPTAGW
ncbi:1-deoxy-D-xylulose-5-phosphate synthase N-terminal domain-containing protein [Candidatus Chloroploca sp. Khr17]|uniref:transketolase-like TK C-terminal-containing protein n=1 Tax=Candidatus Chloroploca sp. Khr17 TaxID=2496869 RepID=UPI00101CF789|nr:1-deoxy-D-xylulose-5-phosphate synthase N-terminal domain-containing protein [Candidatus Chloroploca sp. Khr17]